MSPTFTRFFACGLLLALSGAGTAVSARPGFVGDLEPGNRANIARIVPTEDTDLVIINAGWLEGFRTGMACVVGRGETVLGEILLVDVELNFAVGLITGRNDEAPMSEGDAVVIKTFTASS